METELRDRTTARSVEPGSPRTARLEPVPFSEKVTNGLVKIIALEDIKDIPKAQGNLLIVLFFMALLSAFLYFLISDYNANRNALFLSRGRL